jgi:hypothetical protein
VIEVVLHAEVLRLAVVPDVTTFQAARPPDRWSRVANFRATWNGE